jgi:hypothetical protein
VNIQFPDAPKPTYEPAAAPADTSKSGSGETAQTTAPDSKTTPNATTVASNSSSTAPSSTNTTQTDAAALQPKAASFAPSSDTNNVKPIDVATAIKNVVNSDASVSTTSGSAKETPNVTAPVEDLKPKNTIADTTAKPGASSPAVIELRLNPDKNEMTVGEKRQFTVELNSETTLGLAVVMLRFDPNVIKINNVTLGKLFADAKSVPIITKSTTEKGAFLVSLAPAAGGTISGQGALLNIDVEAVAPGEAALAFDISNVHVVSTDGRVTVLQLAPMSLTVKPQVAAKAN